MKKILIKIEKVIKLIFYTIFKMIFAIKKKRIYFISNQGNKYACNPKAYFEYLYDNHHKEFEFYYCYNGDKNKVLPSDVKSAKYMSLKDLYYLATAKYIVNNFRFGKIFKKRKNQVYIQSWHGIPLKMIEKDVKNINPRYEMAAKNDSAQADMVLVSSQYEYNIFKNCFYCEENKIFNIGNPRYDMLKQKGKNFDELKNFLNIEKDDFIVLYAPTFRDNVEISKSFLDNKKIKTTLEKATKKKVKIFYRFHPNIAKQTENIIFEDFVYNMTNFEDIQDLILVSDLLITDFSSCMFDMMIADKPCIVYCNDKQQYISQERGTYMDINELPFNVVETENEVLEILDNYERFSHEYKSKYKKFEEEIGLNKDKSYCKNLYEKMIIKGK